MTLTKRSRKRKAYSMLFRTLMTASAVLVAAAAVGIIGYVLWRGVPMLNTQFMFTRPSYLNDTVGILPALLNTIYMVLLALVLIVPIGVGSAIYLSEYASSPKLVMLIEKTTEILAGIPSIIFGLAGMLLFCQFFGLRTSLLAGTLTVVIMNLPGMIRSVQESLKTVPVSLKEAAYGLGAGKWKVIRSVVIPGCLPGIITGIILSAGRIIGESACLLFTAGFASSLNGFFDAMTTSGSTLSVALYVYAREQGNFDAAFGIAAVLILLICVITIAVRIIQNRMAYKNA